MQAKSYILPLLVVSQFFTTSIWFAGNGIMPDLIQSFGLQKSAVGHLTASVQLGFIGGTLLFAWLSLADRISPSKLFFVSALAAALFNLGPILPSNNLLSLSIFRFMCGFFLAGIYPVGMKIAADYFGRGLGKSLGFLVGALVLGTALPHLFRGLGAELNWRYILVFLSVLAALGGLLLIRFVPDGPLRKAGPGFKPKILFRIFRVRAFRSAAFGYFGHMWELYAFWAFIPLILQFYTSKHPGTQLNTSFWSFLIIGMGGLACALGGILSFRIGAAKIARWALSLSFSCCLLSPLVFTLSSPVLFVSFLVFWGGVVVADSPMFSTLVAQSANSEFQGSALTLVNCIGFSITVLSIQLLTWVQSFMDPRFLLLILALGPGLGLYAMRVGVKSN